MAESQRIEDLRKRYHENPRRFFAPLANEYRKAGHFDRALLLCEKHLKEQPDNMNGLVVYGQALYESERLEDAKEPLTAALGVDPENLIALRLLGDISRLGGDFGDAKKWYEKVLEVDRRNDEVLDLLEQMAGGAGGDDAAPAAPELTSAAEPLVTVAGGVSLSGADAHDNLGMIDLEPPAPAAPTKPKKPAGAGSTVVIDAAALARADMAPPAPSDAPTIPVQPPAPPAPRPPKRASLLDVAFDFSDVPKEEAPALAVPAAPVSGSEAAEYSFDDGAVTEPLVPQASAEATPTMADSLATDGLMIETTGDVAPMAGLESTEFAPVEAGAAPVLEGLQSSELEAPDVVPLAGLESAAEDVLAPKVEVAALEPPEEPPEEPAAEPAEEEAEVELTMLETDAPAPPRPRMTKASLSSLPLLADYGLEDDAPATDEPRKAAKTPAFVTETMATLYIKQGYKDQAIEVYRQLIAQDPQDAGLKERLAALERGDETGLDFEEPAADVAEPTPAPANAVLDDVSFAEVGLSTPAPQPSKLAVPAPSGPSAREFFGAFARRSAVPAGGAVPSAAVGAAPIVESATVPSPAQVASSGWPLDALFGAADDIGDLHAAEVIAGVGTFEGPDGGTGLDQLFTASGAPPTAVKRASEMLKFDQFFSPTGASPAPAVTAEPPAPSIEADGSPAAAGDDDLDQFHGWLKGLKPE